jgi:hypothetical protein
VISTKSLLSEDSRLGNTLEGILLVKPKYPEHMEDRKAKNTKPPQKHEFALP